MFLQVLITCLFSGLGHLEGKRTQTTYRAVRSTSLNGFNEDLLTRFCFGKHLLHVAGEGSAVRDLLDGRSTHDHGQLVAHDLELEVKVEVDHLGQAQRVAPANFDYQPTDAQIAYHLARFIEDVRGLPADGIVLRQNWLRAYDFTTDRGAAALNDYARNNDPFAKLGKAQISVDVSSVIRASSESFRVAWTQRTYDNGSLSSTERWTAILTIVIEMPRDAERLRKNPLGVYVRAINWSKELSQ